MTKKDYADVLKMAMQMQIDYVKEDLEKPYAEEEYLNGVIMGLRIAIEKIEASRFLTE